MIVLSHFRRPAPASLANHGDYVRARGYRHVVVDATALPQALPLSALHRYETLLHHLGRAGDGEIVLLMSEDAAIIEPIALDRLMAGRDMLLVRISDHALPQINVQLWRNTPAARQAVLGLIKAAKRGAVPVPRSEAALFEGLATEHYSMLIDGVCAVMHCGSNYDPLWSRVPTFAISIDEAPNNHEEHGSFPRLRDVLVGHINRSRHAGTPAFPIPSLSPASVSEVAGRSTYNPGHPIAITTLYTKEIDSFARIAETNFRRYCEANGYTFYVHREIPRELGLDAAGTWIKPWLLHAYLQHHEWVMWLDADVLIGNQQQRLEPLFQGRDWLVARDIGQWQFNAGVMAFRRTPQNDEILREVMANIVAVPDKSTVYASGGDQPRFIEAMSRRGLLDGDGVVDMIGINTPWHFRGPESLIVHYYGMWWDMRLLMMAYDEGYLPYAETVQNAAAE